MALFCVFSLPLVSGGVRSWSVLPFVLVAAAAVAIDLHGAQKPRLPFVLVPLFGVALINTLMVVPIPDYVARLLTPEYEATRRFVWEALGGDAPRSAPLATNPAVAALDAARAWATLACACVIARRAQDGASTHGVLLTIAGSAVAQVIVALGTLPGFAMSTFVNRNHQAAFFNLAWAASLGAYTLVRSGGLRAVTVLGFSVSVVGVVASLSRAGIAAGGVGAVVFAVLALRRERISRERAVTLGLGAAAVLALAVYGNLGGLASRFVVRAEEKTRVWTQALALTEHYPTGTGRGGFGLAFNAVREPDRERGQWAYVENEYLQALTDYGPVTGSFGIAFALFLVWQTLQHAWRGEGRGRMRRAAIASACTMLALQAAFDFNWEMLGVSLPMWCAIVSLGRDGQTPFVGRSLPMTGVLVVGGLVIVPLLSYGLRHDPAQLDAKNLVRTRPLDAWAMVALAHESDDPKTKIAWLSRAVSVDRDWAEPHLMLAEIFCRSGRASQGRTELRQALRRMSGDHARAFLVLDVCVTKDEDALDFIDAPEALSALLPRWSDQRVLLVAKMIDTRDPALLGPMLAAARRQKDDRTWRSLARIEHPVVWAERAERSTGDEALGWLEKAAKHEQAPRGVRERYVTALVAAGRLDEAEAAAAWIAKDCAEGYGACRPLHVARAKVFLAKGEPKKAIAEYKLVLARDSRDAGIWALLALAYEAAGDPDAAKDARDRSNVLP